MTTTTHTTTSFAAPPSADAPRRSLLGRPGADTRYVLTGLPLAVVSLATLITGLSLGVGLLATTLGVFVFGATGYLARGFADVERLALGARDGRRVRRPDYPSTYATRNPYRRAFAQLRQPQCWLDVLHGVATFLASTFAFVVTVTWWAAAAGGLTYGFWERFLPERGNDVVVTAVLGSYSHTGDIVLFTVAGAVFALTLPFVARGMAALRAGFARTLLVDLDGYRRGIGPQEVAR